LNGINIYPRKLTDREQDWLFFLLPEDVPGYNEYRNKIFTMSVIGEGRFGEGNHFLGHEGDTPDLSYASLPMFACGQIECNECLIQISIHEFYDNKIEFSINNILGETIPEDLYEIKRWSYSYWKPGSPSPFENDELRVINLTLNKNELVLALSKLKQSIWLHESHSGINHIIPVTNFINELLLVKKTIVKSDGLPAGKAGINMANVFSNLVSFADDDFRQAFLKYNKDWKKVKMGYFSVQDFNKK
jgi:hypothetical protein